MSPGIAEKIGRLRRLYRSQEDSLAIDNVERKIESYFQDIKFSELDEAQELAAKLSKRVLELTQRLAFDEKISEVERVGIFRERDAFLYLIGMVDKRHIRKALDGAVAVLERQLREA